MRPGRAGRVHGRARRRGARSRAPFAPETRGRRRPASPAAVVRALAARVRRTRRPRSLRPRRRLHAGVRRPGLAGCINVLNVVTGNLDRPGGAMFTRPAVDLVALAARVGQRGHFDKGRSRVRGLPEFGGEWPVAVLAEEIETPGAGQIRALVTVAGQPRAVDAQRRAAWTRALAGLDFMVSIDLYLNETTRHAHLILPPTVAARARPLRPRLPRARRAQHGQATRRRSSTPAAGRAPRLGDPARPRPAARRAQGAAGWRGALTHAVAAAAWARAASWTCCCARGPYGAWRRPRRGPDACGALRERAARRRPRRRSSRACRQRLYTPRPPHRARARALRRATSSGCARRRPRPRTTRPAAHRPARPALQQLAGCTTARAW